MHSWQHMMPKGMSLKSEGFASYLLYDPDQSFTLAHYCRETQQPYADVGIPVPIERFIAYGLEFQRRLVPNVDKVNLTSIKRTAGGFEATSEAGETVSARRVVVAAGIAHFGYLPPPLAGLPEELVTHSSKHSDLSTFRGRHVVVVGGGASAVDIAAILHEVGAQVELVAAPRRSPSTSRPWSRGPCWSGFKRPRSTIGLGWRSRLCVDAPLLFHRMPEEFRHRVVRKHLGPAPGWFVRDKVEGRFPAHLGVELKSAEVRGNKVHLGVGENGTARENRRRPRHRRYRLPCVPAATEVPGPGPVAPNPCGRGHAGAEHALRDIGARPLLRGRRVRELLRSARALRLRRRIHVEATHQAPGRHPHLIWDDLQAMSSAHGHVTRRAPCTRSGPVAPRGGRSAPAAVAQQHGDMLQVRVEAVEREQPPGPGLPARLPRRPGRQVASNDSHARAGIGVRTASDAPTARTGVAIQNVPRCRLRTRGPRQSGSALSRKRLETSA